MACFLLPLQFAVVDVECSETIMKLQARDQRISELNKQILKLKEDMREQVCVCVCVCVCVLRAQRSNCLASHLWFLVSRASGTLCSLHSCA
jgi:hypothetical protein